MSWSRNFLGGHLNLGRKITIFGANAMDFAVNISTKRWGYICFTLPTFARIAGIRRWYFYCSPNATPWACTFFRGSDELEVVRAQIRKINFGHAFSTQEKYRELCALNDRFESLRITAYDLEKFGDFSAEDDEDFNL